MDIRITYDAGPELRTAPAGLILELRDGTDVRAAWDSVLNLPAQNGRAGVVYRNIALCGLPDEIGQGCQTAGQDNLYSAKVLDIKTLGGHGLKNLQVTAFQPHSTILVPLDMYARDFPSRIPWAGIDKPCRPIVRYFNTNGLPTAMCCSGHPGTNQKRFWVEFQPDITEQDILDFMYAHTPDHGAFTANGMFCMRYDNIPKPGNGLIRSMQYIASDVYDAMSDLVSWSSDDMSGKPGHSASRPSKAAHVTIANLMRRYAPGSQGAENHGW